MGRKPVILLDTRIWVWLVGNTPDIRPRQRELLDQHEASGLGVSVISCWEVAKLVEKRRLALQQPVGDWIAAAAETTAYHFAVANA